MGKIKFSVVIPVYNAEQFIQKSVESVLSQSYTNYELIVVDNGSIDGSISIVQDIIKKNKDREIKIVSLEKNQGISGGRNAGINASAGDFVCFLDADDFWYPHKLLEVRNMILDREDSDIIWHWEHHIKGKQKKLVKYRELLDDNVYIDLLCNGNCLSTSAVSVKRSALNKSGFFDEKLISGEEDYDLWLRMAKNGCKFALIKKPLGAYIIYENSVSAKYEKHTLALINMLEKHYFFVNENLQRFALKKKLNLKKRKAVTQCSCGRRLSLNGERKEGNKYYIDAIKNDKMYIKPYVGIILNLFHL